MPLLVVVVVVVVGTNYEVPQFGAFSTSHLILLGLNVRLRILFSNTLSLHSSLNIRDHVSLPYSTTGNIIVLYMNEISQTSLKGQGLLLLEQGIARVCSIGEQVL